MNFEKLLIAWYESIYASACSSMCVEYNFYIWLYELKIKAAITNSAFEIYAYGIQFIGLFLSWM